MCMPPGAPSTGLPRGPPTGMTGMMTAPDAPAALPKIAQEPAPAEAPEIVIAPPSAVIAALAFPDARLAPTPDAVAVIAAEAAVNSEAAPTPAPTDVAVADAADFARSTPAAVAADVIPEEAADGFAAEPKLAPAVMAPERPEAVAVSLPTPLADVATDEAALVCPADGAEPAAFSVVAIDAPAAKDAFSAPMPVFDVAIDVEPVALESSAPVAFSFVTIAAAAGALAFERVPPPAKTLIAQEPAPPLVFAR